MIRQEEQSGFYIRTNIRFRLGRRLLSLETVAVISSLLCLSACGQLPASKILFSCIPVGLWGRRLHLYKVNVMYKGSKTPRS